MKACWHGHVIAEDERVIELQGYRYFPRASVNMKYLSAVPKTAADLTCPHGVQFFDVADGAASSERAAWSYEAPKPSFAHVDHWIGFWKDVEFLN